LKKIIFAALLFAAPLIVICSQTQDGAAVTDESELRLDSPLPAAQNESPVRESERAYSLEGGGDLQGGVSIWSVLRIFLTLLVVALAIYGILYFFKYSKRNKDRDINSNKYLKILAAAPVNTKTTAAVISVGKQAWLIGLADSSVSLIAEINDQETVDVMLLDYSQRAASSGGGAIPNFFTALRRFIPAGGQNHSATNPDTIDAIDSADDIAERLRKNRDRLHNL
jgi:flagellar biogenesis protein FliO